MKKHPGHAELHFGTARAFAPSDRKLMAVHAQAALKANPKHIGARLMMADHLIDREGYQEAEVFLDEALKINPHHPEAWAYRSVIAHLRNDRAAEKTARAKALAHWKTNPRVHHLIGKKLSQKYRFAEGSAHQRQALVFQKDFLPAKIQLAQDLLRLGQEKEGWALAEHVHAQDGYDVTTYNQSHSKAHSHHTSLTNANFIVRMEPREAWCMACALRLLERAHQALCGKYGLKLDRPVTVEIFADQNDFGMHFWHRQSCSACDRLPHYRQQPPPNSPRRPIGNQSCGTSFPYRHPGAHENKMPRWLSEGISVYEERQANPAWGARMSPRFREMILGGELTPVGKLSGASRSQNWRAPAVCLL